MNRVHIHSTLAFHGGAARVAGMTGKAALQAGYEVLFSCEIPDFVEVPGFGKELNEVAESGHGAPGAPAGGTQCRMRCIRGLGRLKDPGNARSPDNQARAEFADKSIISESLKSAHHPGKQCAPQDDGDAFKVITCSPETLALAGQADILHLHATQNWECVLGSLLRTKPGQRVVLTLHDARLLTGGCIHPLQCRAWMQGCEGECLLRVSDAAMHCRTVRDLLREVRPVLVCPSAWLGRMARTALPDCVCRIVPNGVEDPVALYESEHGRALSGHGADGITGKMHPGASLAEGTERLAELKSLARREMGIARPAKVLLFAAHGGERCLAKGGDKWLAIWERVKTAVPEALGILAGGERLERQGDVLYWPYVGREAMNMAMLAADIFVHVSLAENHPLVVLEAFAAGVPACAFAVGGIPEQIADGACGSLHPCGDYDGLVRSVTQALRRPSILRNWSFAARKRYERHFTMQRMCAEYLKIYDEILGR